MSSRGRFGSALLVVATLAGACGEDARDERPALSACGPPPRELAGDPTVLRVLDGLPQRRIVDGVWLNGYDNTRLTIELEVGTPMSDDDRCGQPLLVPVTGRVRSSDGFIDARPDHLRVTASIPAGGGDPRRARAVSPVPGRARGVPACRPPGGVRRAHPPDSLRRGAPLRRARRQRPSRGGEDASRGPLVQRAEPDPARPPQALPRPARAGGRVRPGRRFHLGERPVHGVFQPSRGGRRPGRQLDPLPRRRRQPARRPAGERRRHLAARNLGERPLRHPAGAHPPGDRAATDRHENNGRPGLYQVDLAGDLATRATRIWGNW